MGCVSSLPPQTNSPNSPISNSNDTIYKPINAQARQLEYPRRCNEIINNPYSAQDWIEVREYISDQWVIATVIDTMNNWIRVLSQNINIQFIDKLHVIKDSDRIRMLGPKTKGNNLDTILHSHGFELINEIKYDESDTCKDTIFKSFEYQMYHSFGDNKLSEDILLHINNESNDAYLSQYIHNWDKCKENIDGLTDKQMLIILSHYCKFNVISYQCNDDLQIVFDHKCNDTQNENEINTNAIKHTISLLYIPTSKQYKLMTPTMDQILQILNITETDTDKWSAEQVIKWINCIEFGLFNDAKYDTFKKNLSQLQINGSNIGQINELTLKAMGIRDEMAQKLMSENINKLQRDESNNHMHYTHTTAGNIESVRETPNSSESIPEAFLDPIHYLIMRDPVISTVSGHSFERKSITEWINENHTDPINQKPLHLYQLISNRTLRHAIDKFLKVYGSQFTETKR